MVSVLAMSAGKDELDARWKEGQLLRVRLESGESLIGTSEGVVKARFQEKARKWRKVECGGLRQVADPAEFTEIVKIQKRIHKEKVPHKERLFGGGRCTQKDVRGTER